MPSNWRDPQRWLVMAWTIALTATLGSWYFSEILGLAPCELCWYQRIVMIPILLVLTMILWRVDWDVIIYLLPMSVIGILLSSWHVLIQYVPWLDSIETCEQGIACTKSDWSYGWVTIPLLSWLAFMWITVLLLLAYRYRNEEIK